MISHSTIQNESDEHLVALIRQGDQAAFSRLVGRHRRFVDQIVSRFCFRDDDSDEVVQDTFVKIWKKVDQFDGRSALTTWIYTITFNLCLDRTRAIRRRKEITFGENFIPEMADNSEDPGIPDDESFIAAVRLLSFKMSKIQRLVFILRDIQDQPVDEVCRITGLDPDRIKANLYHARKFMREKLVKGGYV